MARDTKGVGSEPSRCPGSAQRETATAHGAGTQTHRVCIAPTAAGKEICFLSLTRLDYDTLRPCRVWVGMGARVPVPATKQPSAARPRHYRADQPTTEAPPVLYPPAAAACSLNLWQLLKFSLPLAPSLSEGPALSLPLVPSLP